MSPDLRLFLEAMQQDFHTTLLIALGMLMATFTVSIAMGIWGFRSTTRLRRETAKYAADAQATMQAILAAVRRPQQS